MLLGKMSSCVVAKLIGFGPTSEDSDVNDVRLRPAFISGFLSLI